MTGEAVEVLAGIRRILAPNPSVMTGPGTNTYLIGTTDVVVIDPGPKDEDHLNRIVTAANGRLRYVVVTHSHRDHAPGALPLARATGATVLAFDFREGLSPDARIGEGDVVVADDWRLEALHTPGHASDHLCFIADHAGDDDLPRVVFSGDHIMGGSTVVVGPPDGDMRAYFDSLDRIRTLQPPCDLIAPGHGQIIDNPDGIVAGYIRLRLARESAIYRAVCEEPRRASEIVPLLYSSLSDRLVRAATRTVWAHLRKLHDDGQLVGDDPDDPESIWRARAE